MPVPGDRTLPPLPPALSKCLRAVGVDIPDRDLTVGEVERLWKQDRRTVVLMDACGARTVAWYEQLRNRWR